MDPQINITFNTTAASQRSIVGNRLDSTAWFRDSVAQLSLHSNSLEVDTAFLHSSMATYILTDPNSNRVRLVETILNTWAVCLERYRWRRLLYTQNNDIQHSYFKDFVLRNTSNFQRHMSLREGYIYFSHGPCDAPAWPGRWYGYRQLCFDWM